MDFTKNEIEYLEEYYNKLSAGEIAKRLKRKQGSISRKLLSLNLISDRVRTRRGTVTFKEDGKRNCASCSQIKVLSEFSKNQYSCKACQKTLSRSKYLSEHQTVEGAIRHKLNKAKHAKRDFDNPLTFHEALSIYRAQNGKCYYTGLELTPIPKQLSSMVMDRKDSSKGYSKDNIVFCCHQVNMMKQSLDVGWFKTLCNMVSDLHPMPRVTIKARRATLQEIANQQL